MKKVVLSVTILLVVSINAGAQGCSDAGFCSIHSIKNNTGKTGQSDKNNQLTVGFILGKGERSISYYTWELEYTGSITKRTSATAKVGYSFISGELAKTSGPSDLFLSVHHAFDVNGKWQKSFVAGLKIPFDKADIIKNGVHLPMPYQTSLGTTDLVLGLNLIRNSFGATIAVQQPLKSVNGNRFLPENNSSVPLANHYLPSNKFLRKGDVLVRFSYAFDLDERFSIRPSLLGIYHVTNDTYQDVNNVRREISKSSGLTANVNVFVDYRLKRGGAFELSLGAPFVVRVNRPDGLTRSLVAAINYKFGF